MASHNDLTFAKLKEVWGTNAVPGGHVERTAPTNYEHRMALAASAFDVKDLVSDPKSITADEGNDLYKWKVSTEETAWASSDVETAKTLRKIEHDYYDDDFGETRATAPNLAFVEASAANLISGAAVARVHTASRFALGPLAPSGFALRPSDTIIDLLGVCTSRLGFPIPEPSNLTPVQAPLTAHDQGVEDACVAASSSLALFLRAVAAFSESSVLRRLRASDSMPSVAHAYHSQRRDECKYTSRVDCGPGCNGLCNPNAGTILPFMLQAISRGVVMERSWPFSSSASLDHVNRHNNGRLLREHSYYTLDAAEEIDLKSDKAVSAVLAALRDNCPIIVNAYVFSSQERFYSSRMGTTPSSEGINDVWHPHWTLPKAAKRQLNMGHCMTIVGANTAKGLFKVRNSFGSKWGCDGDFNWPFDQLNSRHINSLVIFRSVTLHVAEHDKNE